MHRGLPMPSQMATSENGGDMKKIEFNPSAKKKKNWPKANFFF
jgi:hypothetical protein